MIRNDKFILKCEATGNPGNISFSWRKDNLTILSEDTFGENSSRLERRLERGSEGMYYCEGRNSVGLGRPCVINIRVPGPSYAFVPSSYTIVTLVVSCVLVLILTVTVTVVTCRRCTKKSKEYCVSSNVMRKK